VTSQRAAYASVGAPVLVQASPRFGPILSALFPDYQVTPPPGPIDLELRDLGAGQTGVHDDTGAYRYGSLAEALTHFELGLAQMLADRVGSPLLHAGGVTAVGGALLLPGESGSGKSSLTAGLAAVGYPVLADDAVILDAELPGVRPFKRLLKVHDAARRALNLGDGEPILEAISTDATFYRPESLGSRWAPGAAVQYVIFPERRTGVAPDLRPERPGEGVRQLMGLVLQGGGTPAHLFDALTRITDRARFFRLSFDDSGDAVRHLRRALRLRAEAVE